MRGTTLAVILASTCAVMAKTVVVTVGGQSVNETDATLIFDPQTVLADEGDVVLFNFTFGNHTVTRSDFATPCVPIHDSNITINGFDSSFRDAGDEQAITQLSVTITPDLANGTIWFFDFNTCGDGGVGGINVDSSSWQPFDAFVRNALRLNGTESTETSSTDSGPTGTDSGSSPADTSTGSNAASRTLAGAFVMALPMAVAAFALAL